MSGSPQNSSALLCLRSPFSLSPKCQHAYLDPALESTHHFQCCSLTLRQGTGAVHTSRRSFSISRCCRWSSCCHEMPALVLSSHSSEPRISLLELLDQRRSFLRNRCHCCCWTTLSSLSSPARTRNQNHRWSFRPRCWMVLRWASLERLSCHQSRVAYPCVCVVCRSPGGMGEGKRFACQVVKRCRLCKCFFQAHPWAFSARGLRRPRVRVGLARARESRICGDPWRKWEEPRCGSGDWRERKA